MSDAPYLSDGWGIQQVYRNFLLAQRNGSGARELHRLALIWVHEPLTPFVSPALRQPALILTWPEGRVSRQAVEQVLETRLHAPLYDAETGTMIGVRPSLYPLRSSGYLSCFCTGKNPQEEVHLHAEF